MSLPQDNPIMTAEEYLAFERSAVEKHELFKGACVALAGASRRHNMLAGRLFAALLNHLEGSPCYPYMSEMRLHIQTYAHYVYPDIMVVCGEEAYVAEDMVNDATVIIEVLSESTESYDRGTKFLHYQSLASFREYVLINQDVMQVEVFHRKDQTEWVYRTLTQPSDALHIDTIQFSLDLGELYKSIVSDQPEK